MTELLSETASIPHREHELEISYVLRGGCGETVVYLHGLGSSKREFLDLVRRGAFAGYRLFSFDFPGAGDSTYLDQASLAVEDLVELTSRIVTKLELGGLTLIGHSMGGLVALRFAERYPAMVKRLVSVEGNLSPEDCGVFSRRVAESTWEMFTKRGLMESLQREFAALPYAGSRAFADGFRRTVSARAFYDYCVSIVEHSDSNDLMAVFEKLEIPRMFVHGDANRHLSYLPQLSQQGIRVTEIANSHHWPHLDNPDAYLKAVADFIAGS